MYDTVSVKVPVNIAKSFRNKTIYFFELYNKMEKENWIDEKLEKPMEMSEFRQLLSKNL